jgi:hypothetical protein
LQITNDSALIQKALKLYLANKSFISYEFEFLVIDNFLSIDILSVEAKQKLKEMKEIVKLKKQKNDEIKFLFAQLNK